MSLVATGVSAVRNTVGSLTVKVQITDDDTGRSLGFFEVSGTTLDACVGLLQDELDRQAAALSAEAVNSAVAGRVLARSAG